MLIAQGVMRVGMQTFGKWAMVGGWLLTVFAGGASAQAPNLTADEKAAILLESGHRAYNEQQYPQAIERYREYLKNYAGSPDASSARYGLGVALLELPQRDYKAAIEAITGPAGDAKFGQQAFALYYLGLAYRAQGHDLLLQIAARPNEAAQLEKSARELFALALPRFTDAAALLVARAKTLPMEDGNLLSADADWAIRARVDQAEMLLRLDKAKEALALTEVFADKPLLAKSRFRVPLLYYHAQSCFLLKDYPAAGRTLAQLAPFDDPAHGVHAQYLLARVQHLLHETTEAQLLYDAVRANYDKQKAAAQARLQNGEALKNQPEERARLEAFVRKEPEYVLRAMLYSSVLLYELQKFGEAQTRLAALVKANPQWPLVAEAQLRQGMCEVRSQQYQAAVATLQPLLVHPQLADRALLYAARAGVALADAKNAPAYTQALQAAADKLRQAADKARDLAAQDPAAKLRRSECQMELGDTLQLNKDYAGAVQVYTQALAENLDPDRGEELSQRLATSLHLAGKYDESDAACQKFVGQWPRSALLAAVLFRSAENAYARAGAADPTKPVTQSPEALKWYGECGKRYEAVISRFPEFAQLPMARYHLGVAFYRQGDFAKAAAQFKAIEGPDRQGELAAASYYQADCALRGLSFEAADAIAAGRLAKTLEELSGHFASFAASDPTHPLAGDAMLKLAVCQTQLAALTADPKEREAAVNGARQTFDKLLQQYAKDPVLPRAYYERAQLLLTAGDAGGAVNELNRFKADPFKSAEVAPLALLRLGGLLRAQNKAEEAATMLGQARQQYEAALAADPGKIGWAALLAYQHGLAVKQTGKFEAARGIFDAAAKQYAARPEALEYVWRSGQCRREEIMVKLDAARKTLARTDAKPEERASALQLGQDAAKVLAETGQALAAAATAGGDKAKNREVPQKMLYEAAWCYRTAAGMEVEAARKKLFDEAVQKAKEDLARRFPAPAKAPQVRVSDPPLSAVAVQPSEQLAAKMYEAAIQLQTDSPTSQQARFELGELLAQRGGTDKANALFQEVLESDLPPDLEERTRLALGAGLLLKGDFKGAAAQFGPLAANDKSPSHAEGKYRLGECFIAEKNWPKAIEQLLPFRDHGPLQNVAGLSDRALLRLGYSQGEAQQWEASRQTYEVLINRFAQSLWRHEARYGMGWAQQQQKQFDQAVATYQQLAQETAAAAAAKGLLQAGLCRAEQKRWPEAATALLAVADGYDYASLSAPALLEAARVKVAMEKPEEAIKHLERVVRDYPDSDWAKEAKARLGAITVPVKAKP